MTDFGPLWGCKSKTGGLSDLRQARAIALAQEQNSQNRRISGLSRIVRDRQHTQPVTNKATEPALRKEHAHDDGRGAPREKPLAFGKVATGARHRPETAHTTAMACRRHFTLDMVQAAEAGAGRGHCMRDLRPRGIFRGGVDPRPCPVRRART